MKIHSLSMMALAVIATVSVVAQTSQPTAPATATDQQQPVSVSQVRIVRLSQTKGEVRLDRQTGQKFEEAFVNVPIVAGERLETLTGLAEVEFEDNSSLRLTPDSLVEFPVLRRDASGATVTTVKLVSGSFYISLAESKTAQNFTVLAGNRTIILGPSAHVRLELTKPEAKLAIFKGTVTVGAMAVEKKHTVTFDPGSDAVPVLAHNDGAALFDNWDKTETEYHQARSTASGFANSPYSYGTSDLNYYGSFASYDGCGTMWRPYLADAAWSPYGSGVWTLYPGAGYSWVSPYPWGWTPYHSGNWLFCPSSGSWGWQPTGGWNGLNNLVATRSVKGPIHTPEPPHAGEPSLVAVNVKSLPTSRAGSDGSFVFAQGSAGLGVPRGTFNNLNHISQTVNQRGSVTTSLSDSQAERAMLPVSRSASYANTGSHSSPGLPSAGTSMSSSSSISPSAAHSSSSGGTSGGHH